MKQISTIRDYFKYISDTTKLTLTDTSFDNYSIFSKKKKDKVMIYKCNTCGKLIQFFFEPIDSECRECKMNNLSKYGDIDDKLFNRWMLMFERCYNKASESYARYGAKGVTVSDKWLNFDSYRNWMISNGWSNENSKDLELDKDFKCITQNIEPKVYSPETCILITRLANRKLGKMLKNSFAID